MVRSPETREAMMADRRALVAGLLDSGASVGQITRAIAERYDYLTPMSARDVARRYVAEARKARVGEYREAKAAAKAEQVARIKNDLIRMRSCGRPPWSAIAKAEDLLARILGTLEPIGVNVSGSVAVHESLIAVIQRMDPQDVEAIVSEELALEAAAASAGFAPPTVPTRLLEAKADASEPVLPLDLPSDDDEGGSLN